MSTTDTLSPSERSERMGRVHARDTKPEMIVRRLAHGLGYRYRLQGRLPGRPDLVFAGRRCVVFVNGCFWHRHPDADCKLSRLPKSRLDFWIPKLEKNRSRDLANVGKLCALGWRVLIVWECELRDAGGRVRELEAVARKLTNFLDGSTDDESD